MNPKYLPRVWMAIAIGVLTAIVSRPVPAQTCGTLHRRPAAVPLCPPSSPGTSTSPAGTFEQRLRSAFERRQSNLQIAGWGTVVRLLSDDWEGNRHQRFILRLRSGQTLLVAHNIDLAPRVPSLRVGDIVEFYGEYEWNEQGGVIHWTHRDPTGRHVDGWLKHKGKIYQ
ncbi:DUF3465 domain-containing protein [Trichothermofontia sp.]